MRCACKTKPCPQPCPCPSPVYIRPSPQCPQPCTQPCPYPPPLCSPRPCPQPPPRPCPQPCPQPPPRPCPPTLHEYPYLANLYPQFYNLPYVTPCYIPIKSVEGVCHSLENPHQPIICQGCHAVQPHTGH